MIEQAVKPTRPILRYHGGKWMLADWVLSNFPPHRVYVEPFGGAASVLLQKPRAYTEVYNDLDGEIVNLFRVLRTNAAELDRQLRLTPYSRTEYDQSFEASSDSIEQARRTITRGFLAMHPDSLAGRHVGFRSRCGGSSAHQMRGTSFVQDWRSLPDQVSLWASRLQGVVIECVPAETILSQHDGDQVLFYVDPPYVAGTRVDGKYRHEMTDADHRKLAEALHALKGMVVLSGYASTLYDAELYADWKRIERRALADGATERTEVLWLNRAAVSRNRQQGLFAQEVAA